MTDLRITPAGEKDYDELTRLWEGSVRATHGFVSEDDLLEIKAQMPDRYLPSAELYCLRELDGRIAAFAGVDGRRLDMLFVRADMLGRGLGSYLLDYAIRLGVREADVNEQNGAALKFYMSRGFAVVSRDQSDSAGRPYPILHLALERY